MSINILSRDWKTLGNYPKPLKVQKVRHQSSHWRAKKPVKPAGFKIRTAIPFFVRKKSFARHKGHEKLILHKFCFRKAKVFIYHEAIMMQHEQS